MLAHTYELGKFLFYTHKNDDYLWGDFQSFLTKYYFIELFKYA
jgi:hypothetical protein